MAVLPGVGESPDSQAGGSFVPLLPWKDPESGYAIERGIDMDAVFTNPKRWRWVRWLATAAGVVIGGHVVVATLPMITVRQYGF